MIGRQAGVVNDFHFKDLWSLGGRGKIALHLLNCDNKPEALQYGFEGLNFLTTRRGFSLRGAILGARELNGVMSGWFEEAETVRLGSFMKGIKLVADRKVSERSTRVPSLFPSGIPADGSS